MYKLQTALNSFWFRQIIQVKKEGYVAVRRKARLAIIKLLKLPINLAAFTLAVPVVLFVRLIKPFKLVRFGYFFAGRLGHFAFDVEYYLTEKRLKLHPENAFDIFFYRWMRRERPANEYFHTLTKRNIHVHFFARHLFFVNNFLPGGEANQYFPAVTRIGSRDINGLFHKVEPQIKLSDKDDALGLQFLNNLGLKESKKFVCLIVRDPQYLNSTNYNYHNYRDSNIDTYEEAALALAEKGYWVFRMGKVVNKPFKADHPRILDYANSEYRSDFLDIWLMANCYFTISTSTGLDDIAVIFRKPILFVNHLPVGDCRTGSEKYTEQFKILKWKNNGKYLSLREQIYCGAIHFLEKQRYDDKGIIIIDNTPKEIKDAVLDMELRLNGTLKENSQDAELQSLFWNIMEEMEDYNKFHGEIRSNISPSFFRNNYEWFLS